MRSRQVAIWVLLVAIAPEALHAQRPPTASGEAADLGAGWAAIASGDAGRAITIAASAIARHPRSLSIGALAITARLIDGGSAAALATYEQWLGTGPDDASLVRLVALGLLREALGNVRGEAQQRALDALLAEGDAVVIAATVAPIMGTGSVVALEGLGAIGDETAVMQLIAMLHTPVPMDQGRTIRALAGTRSRLAIRPLIAMLSDPLESNQIAAAGALAAIGAPESISALRGLLQSPMFSVRFASAGALHKLGDSAGTTFMRTTARSPYPMVRAQALEVLADAADASWIGSVRPLLNEPDPEVRLLAARLLAGHDDASARLIQDLSHDPNVAIAEAARTAYAAYVATDFPTLRQFMKDSDALIRVRAAARVLELTR